MKKKHNWWSGMVFLLLICGTITCEHSDCSCFEFGGIASEISNNHGHELIVPTSDFNNPKDGTYSIRGNANHDHQVSFTKEDLETVSGNNSKTVVSTPGGTDNHTHEVVLDCSCF